MRISSVLWRSIVIILLCMVLQACSNEQVDVEKDLHQSSITGQYPVHKNEAGTSGEHYEKEGANSNDGQHEAAGEEITESVESEQQLSDPSNLPLSEPAIPAKAYELPEGFVYLEDVLPDAQYEIRYYSEYNFVGRQIEGYNAPYAIATEEMAEALVKVSAEIEETGYRLLIYDTYRPAKAVEFFKEWSTDHDDTAMKDVFYPNEDKSQLFKRGYLSKKSGHSRGSTVDLTLIEADSGELVDMGSPYDLLDEISYFGTHLITKEQAANRELLKQVMKKYGFKEYSKEWWHYVLMDEPYPTTYFDFDVQ